MLTICRSAIQAIIYTDDIKRDEEKVQTGAVTVNMTKDSLVRAALPKIELMWLKGELPSGDSRCRDAPPSEELVKDAVNSLRNVTGEDIHFAKNDDAWYKQLFN